VACLERGVELTLVPTAGRSAQCRGLVGAADQRCKRTVVVVGIDPKDVLVLDSALGASAHKSVTKKGIAQILNADADVSRLFLVCVRPRNPSLKDFLAMSRSRN
jgi:hypothetical protein